MYSNGMLASKIYKLLKKHASHSGIFKAIKHFREIGICMPMIRKTPKKPVKMKRLMKFRNSKRQCYTSARQSNLLHTQPEWSKSGVKIILSPFGLKNFGHLHGQI